jgi:OOP family OmpA-OmpF porin
MLKKLACGFFIGSAAIGAFAQTVTDIQAKSDNSAYMQDARGVIVRSPYGLCWRTGDWTPAAVVTGCDGKLAPPIAKATAPAIATAPAPVVTAVTVPKRCDFAVTLTNDQTFVFNKAVLSNPAKKRLDDEIGGKLAVCSKIDMVVVTGHADRLGSQQYNQKLSEKRTNAVAAHLKSNGISAQVDTLGVGKTQAIKSCDDKLDRKKLIECLAPNRRVVIEAHGLAK